MNTKMLSYAVPALMVGALLPALANAQEYGKVISKAAVFVQVATPERQCVNQQQTYQPRTSGTGSVLGAVAGGVVGNAMGRGAGQAAATGLGVIAGAVIGDRVEASNTPPAVATVQSCQTVMRNENRFAGYEVTYEYNGQRYTTRVAHDPGDRIALNVNVSPQDAQQLPPATSPEPVYASPVTMYSAPTVVYAAPPVVYAPYPPMYWGPSVGVNLGWGWGHGYHHWH